MGERVLPRSSTLPTHSGVGAGSTSPRRAPTCGLCSGSEADVQVERPLDHRSYVIARAEAATSRADCGLCARSPGGRRGLTVRRCRRRRDIANGASLPATRPRAIKTPARRLTPPEMTRRAIMSVASGRRRDRASVRRGANAGSRRRSNPRALRSARHHGRDREMRGAASGRLACARGDKGDIIQRCRDARAEGGQPTLR